MVLRTFRRDTTERRQWPPPYAGLLFDDLRDIMSAEALYVVLDAGKPLTAFTDTEYLKAYLKRMSGTFNRPLVYKIDEGSGPVIMTVSRVMAGGLDLNAPLRRRDLPLGQGR
jgi:hypothetical protein